MIRVSAERIGVLILGYFCAVSFVFASDGGTVAYGGTQTITAFSVCRIVTNNSATLKSLYVPTYSSGEWSSFYTNPPAGVSVNGCASCTLPWGGTLAHGGSVTAYSTNLSTNCAAASQTRTCTNGVLSGSYTYSACTTAANCTLPWGGTLAHGGSVTAYAASQVPYGSTCSSQSRSCNNGSLSGSYQFNSCSARTCSSGGEVYLGYCFELGTVGQNCNQACSAKGGKVCELTATRAIDGAAQDATADSRCRSLQTKWNVAASGNAYVLFGTAWTAVGCGYINSASGYSKANTYYTGATCAGEVATVRRICGCE